jgi:SPX domain protein involved in polyphosphate accumulation
MGESGGRMEAIRERFGQIAGEEYVSVEEVRRLPGPLQQFIEINATGFRKILKKWDKRSKSNTKELFLERQVEIQPCFNREVSRAERDQEPNLTRSCIDSTSQKWQTSSRRISLTLNVDPLTSTHRS